MKIPITNLREHIVRILDQKFGAEEVDAIVNYISWAEMAGITTQGLVKLTGAESVQSVTPIGEIEIVRDTPVSRVINANKHSGMYSARVAVDVALEKAGTSGIAIVGVRNVYSSNGAQSYYVEQIAQAGYIGIMCSRSPASQSAFGGIDPVFGTNPVGFAFPTMADPVVFDMATSAMTWYGLVLARARGEAIPEGKAIDVTGVPTTDPAAAMNGSLLPFGGYKSSCLAMMVELLAGPLIGSAYIDNKTFDQEWGYMIIAIDPNILTDIDEFKLHATDMMSKISSARTLDGDTIRIPGVRTREAYQASLASGMVEVDDAILTELNIPI